MPACEEWTLTGMLALPAMNEPSEQPPSKRPPDFPITYIAEEKAWQLDLTGNRAIESGAFLLSKILWPKDGDAPDQRQAFGFLYASMVAAKAEHDREWGMSEQMLRPALLRMVESRPQQRGDTVENTMKHRIEAGRMAFAFFERSRQGAEFKHPPGIADLTVSNLSEIIAEKIGNKDSDSVVKRVWQASLPVVHLCVAAMLLVLEEFEGADPPPRPFLASFSDGSFLAKLLNIAMQYEKELQSEPCPLPHRPDLIRFRFVPAS